MSKSFNNINHIFVARRKWNDLVYKKDPHNPSLSLFTCGIILLNANFGTDPFFMGGGFDCGFGLILFLVVVSYLLSVYSYFLYMKSWSYGQSFSYRTIWEHTISQKFVWLPDLFIVLNFFCWTMYYYDEAYWMFFEVIRYYIRRNRDWDPPSWLRNKWFVTYGLTALSSLICCFFKEVHLLAFTSYIGIICLIIPTIINLYKFYYYWKNDEYYQILPNIIFKISNWKKIMAYFSYVIGVFLNNSLIEHIVQVMKMPTYGRLTKVYITSTFIGFLINIINALLGVFLFSQNTYYTSFLYMFNSYEEGIIVSKICCYIYLLTTIYTMEWMEARHFSQMFSCSWELSNWSDIWWIPHVAACLLVILLNSAFQYMSTFPLSVANIFGMVGYLGMGLVFPPLYYLRMQKNEKKCSFWFISASIILLFGSMLLSYCVVMNITTLVSDTGPMGL